MRLETLVTCLDVYENPDGLFALVGVYQDLPHPPDKFAVYFDLRMGVEDAATVSVRVRRAGGKRSVVFQTTEEMVLTYGRAAFSGVVTVDLVDPVPAKLVVELLTDGSVAGSRLLNLKA